jgi:hypothetical protein
MDSLLRCSIGLPAARMRRIGPRGAWQCATAMHACRGVCSEEKQQYCGV